MQPTQQQVDAGHAVYSKRTLSAYDIVVLGISNHLIWRCPTSGLVAHYNTHVSANHLDVGVGTGYFLDRCQFPSDKPRIGLMDINTNTLAFAAKRIARYRPEIYEQNVFEAISADIPPFDSLGVNYLFHCLPGAIADKMVVLDHIRAVLNPGARIFGSTILQGGVARNWAARKLMAFYNRKGIFANRDDDLDGLRAALVQRLEDVNLEVVGCVALFSGRVG